MRIFLRLSLACLLTLCIAGNSFAASGSSIPLPRGINIPLNAAAPEQVLDAFLGTPYRLDGAIDESGRYTLFADPGTTLSTPGLNCSGFVLGASRFLLQKNLSLAEVQNDRLHDSGPDSSLGHDWDFGWDLIMNISESFPRRMLLPGNKSIDPAKATGLAPKGFDLAAKTTWGELLPRFRTGHLYLVSWSQGNMLPGYAWSHYHVGLIVKTADQGVWLYQTTRQGKAVNKRNLASQDGMQSFLRDFTSKQGHTRYLTIIEVPLPSGRLPFGR